MKYNLRFVLGISLISALGGLLFGYDWVVIGGAKPFYERFFSITGRPDLQGWAMSSALIGCIFGALISGWFSDRFGRKKSLIFAAFLFVISALGTGLSGSFGAFMSFRILGGIGIGFASAISPLYIAEISPAEHRGALVSLNQLTIVVGILAAQIINFLIARPVPEGAMDQFIMESWNGQMGWRWMFWAEAVPASLFLGLIFFVPESPRWLGRAGKWEQSESILVKIGGNHYAGKIIQEIADTLRESAINVDFKTLTSKRFFPVLLIGVTLAVFQQLCGINVAFNYAEEVFTAAGYEVTEILLNIIVTGSVNMVFTFVAIRTADRWGRKKLMLFGSGGLTITYIVLGFSYYLDFSGLTILVTVVTGIAIYAMSLAPITWVVLSEIFPNRVRGAAMAVATTMLWISSTLLVKTFPYLNKYLDAYGTFWVYAGICLLGFLFILFRLPETRGRTLEEIEEKLFRKK